MLRADRITVRRSGKTLLDRVSCALAPGRLTVLAGPNGAGKSTLLRVLAGEFAPTEGAVHAGDRPLEAWPRGELARRRAVLPQESSLQFPFRVDEVVLLGRAPHARARETARDHAIAAEALETVEMTERSERIFPTLSGGEKQRVHLARALTQIWDTIPTEAALLLDEPTASMDLAHQHATLRHARRRAEQGVAVLAVLHDLNLTLAYADDVWVLDGGRLVAAGPVAATLTPALVRRVFRVEARLVECPGSGRPCLVTRPLE